MRFSDTPPRNDLMPRKIMSERIDEVEIKLAHLEMSMNEMSDALYKHQRSMERLERLFELLQQRIEPHDSGAGPDAGSEIPPHY